MKKLFLFLLLSGNTLGMQKFLKVTLGNCLATRFVASSSIGILNQAADRLENFRERYRQNVKLTGVGSISQIDLERGSGLHLFHYLQEVATGKSLCLNNNGKSKIKASVEEINDSISRLKDGSIRGRVRDPFSYFGGTFDESDIFLYLRMAHVLTNRFDIADHSDLKKVYSSGEAELKNFYDNFYKVIGSQYQDSFIDRITQDQVQKLKEYVPLLERARRGMIFASVIDSPYLYKLDLLNSKFKDALSFVDRAESYLHHKKQELERLKKWEASQEKKDRDMHYKALNLRDDLDNFNTYNFNDIRHLKFLIQEIEAIRDYYLKDGGYPAYDVMVLMKYLHEFKDKLLELEQVNE